MIKISKEIILCAFLCSLSGCFFTQDKQEEAEMVKEPAIQTTDSGLQYIILEPTKNSNAQLPKQGQNVVVHYTGWLYDEKAPDKKGKKFDSSVDRGQPFIFPLGLGRVIKGWDEGVALMKVGEKRRLIIPAHLGYGTRGAGAVIPPNATLVFDVELLEIK